MFSKKSRSYLLSTFCLIASISINREALAQQLNGDHPGESRRFYPDDPLWIDPEPVDVAPVDNWDLSKSYDFLENTFGGLKGSDGPALNVNTLDEVPDSSWFTNRIGIRDMSIDEIVRGPDTLEGPAPGVLLVTGRPWTGITPKFTVKDSRGDTYLLKLDPLEAPELPSSVEIICTKIFHAIGYWVPEDYLMDLDPARLQIREGAVFRTENGYNHPIEQADVEHWLKGAPRNADGKIRVVASRYIPGKVVGEYRYYGTRPDDPNDVFPHERRRELRGLQVFSAWLNHDDARSLNSLDSYVEANGKHHIRHYFQDFGSTMGSGSTSAQQPRGGYEYLWDQGSLLKGMATFGLWTPAWAKVKYPDSASVGNYEADFFEPQNWKTEYPNPAFLRLDAADAFWAARLASRFTDDILRAVVKTGQLSDPKAEAYVTDALIKRRNKVVTYWIARTNPLDDFRVTREGSGWVVGFDNAAIRLGAAKPGATYEVIWSQLDNLKNLEVRIGEPVRLDGPRGAVPEAAWGSQDDAGYRYVVADIHTLHPDFPQWTMPVRVSLRSREGKVEVVGIERPRGEGKDAAK